MRRVLIALLLLVAGAITAELLARALIVPRKTINGHDWLESHPRAYGTAPYLADLLAHNRNIDFTTADDGTWKANDIRSKYLNIVNGMRYTVGNPEHFTHTVYMFGSSTLFSGELPDTDTMPSQLQALMPDYRILNLSRYAATTFAEIQFLLALPVQTGDVVIFYSAVVDATTLPSSTNIPRWCRAPLALSTLLCNYPLTDSEFAPYLHDFKQRYTSNLIEAKDYTESHGATFYNVVQPHVWTMPLSSYEQYAVNISENTAPELGDVFIRAWPIVQAGAPGVTTIDLTHILDERRKAGEVFYFDSWHMNREANRIVARAVYEALSDK